MFSKNIHDENFYDNYLKKNLNYVQKLIKII